MVHLSKFRNEHLYNTINYIDFNKMLSVFPYFFVLEFHMHLIIIIIITMNNCMILSKSCYLPRTIVFSRVLGKAEDFSFVALWYDCLHLYKKGRLSQHWYTQVTNLGKRNSVNKVDPI